MSPPLSWLVYLLNEHLSRTLMVSLEVRVCVWGATYRRLYTLHPRP